MDNKKADAEKVQLTKALLRLHSQMLGLALGLLIGSIIFIATNWLVLQGTHTDLEGNQNTGPLVGLLSHFLLGYSISFWGSIIGFFYGFAFGTITGSAIGFIYNSLTKFRDSV